jgi:hypothetical protein
MFHDSVRCKGDRLEQLWELHCVVSLKFIRLFSVNWEFTFIKIFLTG